MIATCSFAGLVWLYPDAAKTVFSPSTWEAGQFRKSTARLLVKAESLVESGDFAGASIAINRIVALYDVLSDEARNQVKEKRKRWEERSSVLRAADAQVALAERLAIQGQYSEAALIYDCAACCLTAMEGESGASSSTRRRTCAMVSLNLRIAAREHCMSLARLKWRGERLLSSIRGGDSAAAAEIRSILNEFAWVRESGWWGTAKAKGLYKQLQEATSSSSQ
jgi:hypothetical protein